MTGSGASHRGQNSDMVHFPRYPTRRAGAKRLVIEERSPARLGGASIGGFACGEQTEPLLEGWLEAPWLGVRTAAADAEAALLAVLASSLGARG